MEVISLSNISNLCWYAIHVKSRHEFKVWERLVKAGIEAFLPVVERLSRWRDRKKVIGFPLFPGYLFVYINRNSQDRLTILKTKGVVRFLGSYSKPEPIPEEQIISLKRLVENKKSMDPYPYLKEGQIVRIKSGPLAGVEGILTEKVGQHLLVLSIDILQRGVAVKIEAPEVEVI